MIVKKQATCKAASAAAAAAAAASGTGADVSTSASGSAAAAAAASAVAVCPARTVKVAKVTKTVTELPATGAETALLPGFATAFAFALRKYSLAKHEASLLA
ncbi:hypothetical protein A3A71_02030 [Candidatus Berkelbacteria bacterium RIFCSPLOWO2_01_FULL_50_28]|uniref:Gram-positive cocci surface proteins LPxTG domain-containing protein n=1 Tax=Candidatus Berkelbacteria bacterium RIFCSPLOWO2_01_FULL_50_28 TaxID=1797471 RepID=A0A1F5EBK8_9BACT|nr:MAG: hypothetical protein A2807_00425 [Candidatus Berkelbacteria bacterium RIFCSPHIGHO2_01_FULL_50_36]OGD64802.1 MAG: hypothetical protein A3A71_02030 [Candidatus Berkelbacteria bacterium RIFCSPLOWO2_01_FULL_50_28]